MRVFRTTYQLLKQTVKNAQAHNVPRLSAALAFYAIFSLAPMVVITISVAGLVLGTDAVENRIVQEARTVAGDPAAGVIQSIVTTSRRPATNVIAFTASLLFLFFGASRVFVHMYGAMQTIWETKQTGVKRTIQNRLIGIAMVVGAVFAMFLSVVTQAVMASLLAVVGERVARFELLYVFTDALVAFTLTATLIAVIYRYLPRADVRWRAAISGAVVATLLFMVGRFAFGLYLRLGVASTLQGAAGSIVVLILWIYYVAQIIFLGAEFTRAHMLHLESKNQG